MRESELTAAILSELDIRSESPLGLWLSVVRRTGRKFPLPTYFDLLRRLHDQGLVTCAKGELSDVDLQRLIEATIGQQSKIIVDGRGSEIVITAKGRALAEPVVIRSRDLQRDFLRVKKAKPGFQEPPHLVCASFPRCRQKTLVAWHSQWNGALNYTFRIILRYHLEARRAVGGQGLAPLPLVFADEEVLALAYQIACANEIYADPIGRSGARFRALVTAAEAAWLVAHQLYGRIRILLRERKRRLNNEP